MKQRRRIIVVINRLRIGHSKSKMPYGYLMHRWEPLIVNHLLINYRKHEDTKKILEMSDSLFDAFSPTQEYTNKS